MKKTDEQKHHPTGNLPPTFYTTSERQMANHLASHQFVTGIEGGFDSDGKSNLIKKNVIYHFIYQCKYFSCFVYAQMSTKFDTRQFIMMINT